MKRLPHVAMLMIAVALVAADKGEKKKGDAEKIQGKWIVVESYLKGEKSDVAVGGLITFSGKNLTLGGSDGGDLPGIAFKGTFELRPDKKPRELDFTLIGGEGDKSLTVLGIYELSGDTLKWCFLPGKRRPDAMGTAADDKRKMRVLKRVKGDDKK